MANIENKDEANGSGMSENEEMFYQRQQFENYLKLTVNMLSNSTPGTELSKLFKVAINLDRQDVAHKALEYFKPQRLTEMANNQLVEVLTAFILLEVKDQTYTSSKELSKIMRTLDYVILRRIHSFSTTELSKILQAYCHLMRQNKLQHSELASDGQNSTTGGSSGGSTSLIKSTEYMISSKWAEFVEESGEKKGLYQQCKALNALLEIAKMKNAQAKQEDQLVVKLFQAQGVMAMVEKVVYQVEVNREQRESTDASPSKAPVATISMQYTSQTLHALIDLVYWLYSEVQSTGKYGIEDINDEVDVTLLLQEIADLVAFGMKVKPQQLFALFSILQICQEDQKVSQIVQERILAQLFSESQGKELLAEMMTEEIVILIDKMGRMNAMASERGEGEEVLASILSQLDSYLVDLLASFDDSEEAQIDFSEACLIISALHKQQVGSHLPVSKELKEGAEKLL